MVTLRSLCKRYLEERHYDLEDSTREGTERAFRWLAEAVGNKLIDQLDHEDGQRFKNWLIETGRAKTSANIYLRAVNPVFVYAVAMGLIKVNPFAAVKEFRITRKPVRIYEAWQVERLVKFAGSPQWQGLILAGYLTGLRRGALLNLTKENIRSGFVYVEPKRATDRTWPWEPKDRELRKVPVPADLESFLTSLPNFYPLLTPARTQGILKMQQAHILTSRIRKCPLQNFWRAFRYIQLRAFGKRVGDFHMLRKSYGTQMCAHLPDYFVMKLLGHTNHKTMTYYMASRESQFDFARQIASESIKMPPAAQFTGGLRKQVIV